MYNILCQRPEKRFDFLGRLQLRTIIDAHLLLSKVTPLLIHRIYQRALRLMQVPKQDLEVLALPANMTPLPRVSCNPNHLRNIRKTDRDVACFFYKELSSTKSQNIFAILIEGARRLNHLLAHTLTNTTEMQGFHSAFLYQF